MHGVIFYCSTVACSASMTLYPNDRDGNIVTVTKNTEPSCPF